MLSTFKGNTMAIVQTLNVYQFRDAFMASSRKDQFSYEALGEIFEALEEYSDSTGEPVEFDIVGICCDWVEATWQDIAQDYSVLFDDEMTDEDKEEAVADFLCDNTTYRSLANGSFVYVQF